MAIHAHHWIIDRANYGKCEKCGEDRQFPHGFEGYFDKGFYNRSKDFLDPFVPLVRGFAKEKPRE